MAKSKLTLIIDGNWLLMSRFSVMKNRFASDEELCQDLKILMSESIRLMLRTIPKIDNIIMVADGGSWRCELDIPKFLENEGISYKGNREPEEGINWDIVFGAYGDFIDLMSTNNIATYREYGVEGDDWCWYLSRKLNENGTNCIIWSMDKDLTQLVHTDKNTGIFTICWNKLYMTMEDIDKNDMDFLFNYDVNVNEGILDSIIRKAKNVHKINPMDIVIDKIIRGDAGDNVIPIILKQSKSNPNKFFRVSQKDLDMTLDITDENAIDNYLLKLLSSRSYKDKVTKPYEDIMNHFKYNRSLVWLDRSSYPDEILEILDNTELPIQNCTNMAIINEKLRANKATNNQIEIFEEI